MRIGIGYDIHRLEPGRKLLLGGIHIPYEKGLLGHSDADALLHALCDALLGAAGMGDIGQHFPDKDPKFKDISSLTLLSETWSMVSAHHPVIHNIDATIFAQAPRMAPYCTPIAEKIGAALQLHSKRINIKATTTEGIGLIGEAAAIAVMCVVLIE